jgi:quinol monooxygenase YgiN
MIALVYTGKLKDPELLKTMAKVDDRYIAMATHLVEGFMGGVVLGKEDGSFYDCSYWESKEDIERVMENEVVKKIISATEDLIDGSYQVEQYEVLIKY